MAEIVSVQEIPLVPSQAQSFTIPLANVLYKLTLRYRALAGGWHLSIATPDDVMLVDNKPVTTGRDLLEQFRYFGIGGGLLVQTDGDTLAVPTFAGLGVQSHLYFAQVAG